eukprot:m.225890 g.225890  ORF g.225890 m.225890 type:complete len:554 (-) comp35883_c0_seq1:105-1766(-)
MDVFASAAEPTRDKVVSSRLVLDDLTALEPTPSSRDPLHRTLVSDSTHPPPPPTLSKETSRAVQSHNSGHQTPSDARPLRTSGATHTRDRPGSRSARSARKRRRHHPTNEPQSHPTQPTSSGHRVLGAATSHTTKRAQQMNDHLARTSLEAARRGRGSVKVGRLTRIELPRTRQSHTLDGMFVRPRRLDDGGEGDVNATGMDNRMTGEAFAKSTRTRTHTTAFLDVLDEDEEEDGHPVAVEPRHRTMMSASSTRGDLITADPFGHPPLSSKAAPESSVRRATTAGWTKTPVRVVRRLSKEHLQLHDRQSSSHHWTPHHIKAIDRAAATAPTPTINTPSVQPRGQQSSESTRRCAHIAKRLRDQCRSPTKLTRPIYSDAHSSDGENADLPRRVGVRCVQNTDHLNNALKQLCHHQPRLPMLLRERAVPKAPATTRPGPGFETPAHARVPWSVQSSARDPSNLFMADHQHHHHHHRTPTVRHPTSLQVPPWSRHVGIPPPSAAASHSARGSRTGSHAQGSISNFMTRTAASASFRPSIRQSTPNTAGYAWRSEWG